MSAVCAMPRLTITVPMPTKCAGTYRGSPCRRVLALGLSGRVQLKCQRCKGVHWYSQKGVDKPA